ncbi:MAG: single-stranded-DNA-specific exonuclease RecJ [Candidatus Pacebacteria bacterium]|nr:single-stranded-DNA-specific exonuclease RecJ [Candidatus Paceibacterota bacterium]MBP9840145.1 single-stranded-DNA-specific exonuclease RecJ [Candidatus Paceibacterota bacterium]
MSPLHAPIDDAIREELKEFDDLTAALLARRGVTTRAEAETFLNPSYEDHIHDPLLLKNMHAAAKRVARAIHAGERITIWSDYDCDGIPGAVILHDFLKKAGANFDNYIPHRHLEGYGVNSEGIEKLAKAGTSLVITVDSGITDNEAVAHARELGMDVIVTDHHLPQPPMPDAIILDHKQEGETYPFKELCGAVMAWKLVCGVLAVDAPLREKIPVGWEKWLLDMAALATIADMMPLTGENRVIVRYGLLVLRKSPRVGLQKLCKAMRVNQSRITEDDVAFMLAPRVNAASRMGDPRYAFTLFTTSDEAEAETLAKKLESLNRSRRASAGAITKAVHAKLEELKASGTIPSVIVLGDPEWRPALLGLVASGIASEYERPVFLWGREGNDTLKGSCRSWGNVHLVELMKAAKDAFAEFGGHAYSAGFSVAGDQIFKLSERLVAAREMLAESSEEDAVRADAPLALSAATFRLLSTLEKLAPYGQSNPKPVFGFENATVDAVAWFGKTGEHLRLSISDGFVELEAISFFARRELGKKADRLEKGSTVTVLGNLERDQFSRSRVPRVRIVSLV